MQRCMGCMKEFGKEYDVCPHCGYIVGTKPENPNYLEQGTAVGGRYILGKVLGCGGFGVTYLAWDNRLDRAVAVKEFFPNSVSTRSQDRKTVSCINERLDKIYRDGVRKMIDEGLRISKFSANSNIVNVYDCFEENNTAYIVMEYLEGKDLKDYLKEKGGRLEPEEAVELMLPVLNALEEMHGEKLIHRDVSPDNIYLTQDGKIKLLDFGSARLAVEDSTKSLSVMVKRGFAPKEQYGSRSKQGSWTDVYAVCATLYKLITGKTPPDSIDREGEDLLSFADSGISGREELEKVIFHGMAIEIGNRIQTVSELRSALKAAVNQSGRVSEPAAKPVKVPVHKQNKETAKAEVPQANGTKTGRSRIAIIASVVVLAVVAVVVFALKPWNNTSPEYEEDNPAQVVDGTVSTKATTTAVTTTKAPVTTKADITAECKAAYREFLKKYLKENESEYSVPRFELGYFNDDNIPELFVSSGSSHISGAEIMTYVDGKVVELFSGGSYGVITFAPRQALIWQEDTWPPGINLGVLKQVNADGSTQEVFSYEFLYGVDGIDDNVFFRVNGIDVPEAEMKQAIEDNRPSELRSAPEIPITDEKINDYCG